MPRGQEPLGWASFVNQLSQSLWGRVLSGRQVGCMSPGIRAPVTPPPEPEDVVHSDPGLASHTHTHTHTDLSRLGSPDALERLGPGILHVADL